jgi:hypothetical protein
MNTRMTPTDLLAAYRRALVRECAAASQADTYATPAEAYVHQAVLEAIKGVRRTLEDAIMGQFNEVERLTAVVQAQAAQIDVMSKPAPEAQP